MLEELPEGSGPMREKANKTLEVGGEVLTKQEEDLIAELEQLLFPNKNPLFIDDIRDVRHVFDHMKYSACCEWNFLITNDRHILNKKNELSSRRINVGDDKACIEWLESVEG